MTNQLSDTSILNICSCKELMPLRQAGNFDELLILFARSVVSASEPATPLTDKGSDDYFRSTISKMKETMAAAAEEISEHWGAHCDSEGYGPVNLQRRLEGPYGVNYPGYSLGAFAKLRAELEEAKKNELDITVQYLSLTDAAGYVGGLDAVLSPEEYIGKMVEDLGTLQSTVRKQEGRLDQAAESYLRLVNASCYSDRDDESMSPEEWVNSVVSGGYHAVQRLNFLVSEGLQVYESNGKFRLRQVVDACTVGKSYDTAREAIDAALTDGVSECQCKVEIYE